MGLLDLTFEDADVESMFVSFLVVVSAVQKLDEVRESLELFLFDVDGASHGLLLVLGHSDVGLDFLNL